MDAATVRAMLEQHFEYAGSDPVRAHEIYKGRSSYLTHGRCVHLGGPGRGRSGRLSGEPGQ